MVNYIVQRKLVVQSKPKIAAGFQVSYEVRKAISIVSKKM